MALDDPQILVVDDDDEFRTVLVDTLNGKGYKTLVARHGKEALEILQSGVRPDLILLDLWMPEMDGWQLRHALSSEAAVAGVPIVVMTAAQRQDRAGLEVLDVLEKPFSLDQLVTVVRRHLLDAELIPATKKSGNGGDQAA
jgi:CheY-like chemotaxis protein